MSTTLCFIDTETTGLDPRIHQPYEVCYWLEDDDPRTMLLPHTLEHADGQANPQTSQTATSSGGPAVAAPLV